MNPFQQFLSQTFQQPQQFPDPPVFPKSVNPFQQQKQNPYEDFMKQTFSKPPAAQQQETSPTNPFAAFLSTILTPQVLAGKALKGINKLGKPSREALGNLTDPKTGAVNKEAADALLMDFGGITGTMGKVAGKLPAFTETLFSRLQKSVADASFSKGTGSQWLAQTSKNVAQGERTWTGLDDVLSANPNRMFTKEEIARSVDEMGPKISVDNNHQFEKFVQPGNSIDYKEHIMHLDGRSPAETKYPGGHFNKDDFAHLRTTQRDTPNGRALAIEEIQSDPHQFARKLIADDEPELGKIGYAPSLEDRKFNAAWEPLIEQEEQIRNAIEKADAQGSKMRQQMFSRIKQENPNLTFSETLSMVHNSPEYKEQVFLVDDLVRQAGRINNLLFDLSQHNPFRGSVPDLPFKKTEEWGELALKQAIHEAVQNGNTSIMFPNPANVSDIVGMPQKAASSFYGFNPSVNAKGVPVPGMLQKTLQNYLKSAGVTDAVPVPVPVPLITNKGPVYKSAEQYILGGHFITSAARDATEAFGRGSLKARQFVDAMDTADKEILMKGFDPVVIKDIIERNKDLFSEFLVKRVNTASSTPGFDWEIPVTDQIKELAKSQRMWGAAPFVGLPAVMKAMEKDKKNKKEKK